MDKTDDINILVDCMNEVWDLVQDENIDMENEKECDALRAKIRASYKAIYENYTVVINQMVNNRRYNSSVFRKFVTSAYGFLTKPHRELSETDQLNAKYLALMDKHESKNMSETEFTKRKDFYVKSFESQRNEYRKALDEVSKEHDEFELEAIREINDVIIQKCRELSSSAK